MDVVPLLDGEKPTLFELIAQEQLRDSLQPAIKYVLSVLAQRNPRYLLRLVNRHEEFHAAIMSIVELYYLRRHGASFAENFYGLKRTRHSRINNSRAKAAGSLLPEEGLRRVDIYKSLLFLIGFPYIRAKAQDFYETTGGPEFHAHRSEVPLAKLRYIYWRVYPWLNMALELWLMVFNIRYIFDKTAYYRPWLAWMKIELRRLRMTDATSTDAFRLSSTSKHLPFSLSVRRRLALAPRVILESLKYMLPLSIFFLRFLEWWYSPSSPASELMRPKRRPYIPPPKMLQPHPKGIPVRREEYGMCPMCSEPLSNATALPSGYVFCYRCAYAAAEQHHRCPVTLEPTSVHDLRKIML